jgi:hypothetical protein
LAQQPTPLLEGPTEVAFQPPIGGDPDLQESVMN